jgi:hypothetical protein
MTNRREFLQTGVAVSAFPLTMQELVSADHAPLIHRGVFDGRIGAARAFARELGRRGVPADDLDDGDITRIYRELASRPTADLAIGGMTQHGPLLVAEQLARDRGLRVVLRIEHTPRAGEQIVHAIAATPDTIALAEQLVRRGLDWPLLAAVLAARAGAGTLCTHTLLTPGAAPEPLVCASEAAHASFIHYYTPHAIGEGHAVPLDGPLFTWVVAPAS